MYRLRGMTLTLIAGVAVGRVHAQTNFQQRLEQVMPGWSEWVAGFER